MEKHCPSPSANCRDSPSLRDLGDGLENTSWRRSILSRACKMLQKTLSNKSMPLPTSDMYHHTKSFKTQTYMHSLHNHRCRAQLPLADKLACRTIYSIPATPSSLLFPHGFLGQAYH
ncbi:hypothetical protein V8C40DRAFT_53820 [Trichoderma camerunense]